MTKRAILLGLTGAVTICGLAYFNDSILRQTQFVGSHMPVSVYGSVILFVLINAWVFSVSKKFALTGQEMALIMGMTLVACCIPGTGLLRTFIPNLIMPHHVVKSKPRWKTMRLLDEITPEGMLVQVDKPIYEGTVKSAAGDTIVLADDAAADDAAYENPDKVKVYGRSSNQARIILEYDGATRTAKLDAPWAKDPPPGTRVKVLRNNEDEVLGAYIQGREGVGGEAATASDKPMVPWYAWRSALLTWVPLILALWFGYMGLAMVIHKQWSDHENLPYPVATFAATLLPGQDEGLSAVFRDRKFQVAAGVVLLIYLNNYTQKWFPDQWVAIPLQIDFTGLWEAVGIGHMSFLNVPTILFTGVGMAYLISSEVSLSASIAPVLYILVFWNIVPSFTGTYPLGGKFGQHLQYERYLEVGAYLGMIISIAYSGRHYYLHVMRKAVCLKSAEDIPAVSIWGARLTMAGLGIFAAGMVRLGVDWKLAIIYAIALMIPFLVTSRVLAETGLFFFCAGFWPSAILTGLFGASNIGVRSIYVMFMFCLIIMSSVWESMMPYFVNSLKLISLKKNDVGKGAICCASAVVLGLAVAIPLTIYVQYAKGANMSDTWGTLLVPAVAGDDVLKIVDRMQAQGMTTAEMMHSHEGFSILKIRPMDSKFLLYLGIGMGLFILFSVLRIRLTNWPLHPVIFVIWTAFPIKVLCFSFFLGWAFKALTTRFSGSKGYQSLKPVAIGLIAGELLGAVIPMIFGAIYYLTTGELPQAFKVF